MGQLPKFNTENEDLKHCVNNECSLVLTNDIEASTDGEGWICVKICDKSHAQENEGSDSTQHNSGPHFLC